MQTRKRKLILNGLQLKLTFYFLAVSTLAFLFQLVIFWANTSSIAVQLPNDSAIFYHHYHSMLFKAVLATFGLILPLAFAMGILITFRVAGPVYRMTRFLEEVQRGDKPDDCRIRKDDELQDFCQLLNEVTAPLRVRTDVEGLDQEVLAEVGEDTAEESSTRDDKIAA